MIVAIIPTYRAAATIGEVLAGALPFVDRIIVVDDCSPDESGRIARAFAQEHPAVLVVRHDVNRGVGGAVKTALGLALRLGASIVIKLDADNQMDARYIPSMLRLFTRHPELAMIKGNRFASNAVIAEMPTLRLIGNSALSFLVKLSSGYWNIIDPTNGYVALRSSAIDDLTFDSLADRYFFEIDLLCLLGVRRLPIAELEMPPIYRGEQSSLSIRQVLLTFPIPLFVRTIKRIAYQYILTDINVGTLYGLVGFPLTFIAGVFGIWQWYASYVTGVPRTSGTVVLALLLFITGFQLSLQSIIYDVQFSVRTLKTRQLRDSPNEPVEQ